MEGSRPEHRSRATGPGFWYRGGDNEGQTEKNWHVIRMDETRMSKSEFFSELAKTDCYSMTLWRPLSLLNQGERLCISYCRCLALGSLSPKESTILRYVVHTGSWYNALFFTKRGSKPCSCCGGPLNCASELEHHWRHCSLRRMSMIGTRVMWGGSKVLLTAVARSC